MSAMIALIFALWGEMTPTLPKVPAAPQVAEAIAGALLQEAGAPSAPLLGSYQEDAAVMAYWAVRESELRTQALGDHGASHGVWQLQGPCGFAPLPEQARCWRALAREGARVCGPGPQAFARMWGPCDAPLGPPTPPGWTTRTAAIRRVTRARELLQRLIQRQPGDEPGPSPGGQTLAPLRFPPAHDFKFAHDPLQGLILTIEPGPESLD